MRGRRVVYQITLLRRKKLILYPILTAQISFLPKSHIVVWRSAVQGPLLVGLYGKSFLICQITGINVPNLPLKCRLRYQLRRFSGNKPLSRPKLPGCIRCRLHSRLTLKNPRLSHQRTVNQSSKIQTSSSHPISRSEVSRYYRQFSSNFSDLSLVNLAQ